MPDPNQGLTEILNNITNNVRGIRFAKSLFAKTAYAIVAVVGVWAIIAWRISDNLVQDVFLTAAGLIITTAVLWWTHTTQRFAERNPAQALLEGGELLAYQKFEAETKGGITLPHSPLIEDSDKLPKISEGALDE